MTEPIDNTKIDTEMKDLGSFNLDVPSGPFELSVEISEPEGIRSIVIGQFDKYEDALNAHTGLLKNINVSGFFVIFPPGGFVTSYPKHKIHHIHLTPIDSIEK